MRPRRIAVVFDFDETLAPDSTSAFLKHLGVDTPQFWKERVQPKINAGWDPIPAYLAEMIDVSSTQETGSAITRQALQEFGATHKVFPGVGLMFRRVREQAQQVLPGIEVEFFLVSSGIGEILRSCSIAKHFRDIWACDFSYTERGEIEHVKRVVSFTDKTRFLFHVSKGIFGEEARRDPASVNRLVPEADLHVPMDQMVFVGDGFTDIPCFSLLKKAGGSPIAVFDEEASNKWGTAWDFVRQERVLNLVPADYRKGSALLLSLYMAVRAIAQRIEVEEKLYQR